MEYHIPQIDTMYQIKHGDLSSKPSVILAQLMVFFIAKHCDYSNNVMGIDS
jgi:hypothetical protein